MDYEKAYKEALERAKAYSKGHSIDVNPQAAMAYVFPELKVDDDEQIRKAIVEFFQLQDDNTTYSFVPKKNILAWLEKQKKSVESWPNLSNCKHDCKSCMGKCFYRKEPYQKPVEWTEEEKARIDRIIEVLDWAEEKGRINYSDWGDYVTYVKSLKPQPKEELDEEKLKEGLDKAATDWNSKAYFSPIAMVMDGNGHPCGTKQYTTTHADSFKAGVEWAIKKLKEFEA